MIIFISIGIKDRNFLKNFWMVIVISKVIIVIIKKLIL